MGERLRWTFSFGLELVLAWWSMCETVRITYVFLVPQQFEQIYLKG